MKNLYLLVLALGSMVVYSQEVSMNDTSRVLSEVVITSSRVERLLENTAEVVRVVSSKEIEQMNATSITDVLNYVSGMHLEGGTGSGFPKRSIANMNGFPANYNLVLVDGVRLLSDHIHTGQNIEFVSVDAIERIEIIRGASSAQYGSDAMGGVVNIITKKALDNPQYSSVMSYGDFNTMIAGVNVLSPINDKMSMSLFANWEQSDGAEILKPTQRVGVMGYTRFVLMHRLSSQITDKLWTSFNLNYLSTKMDVVGGENIGALVMPSVTLQYTSDKFIVGSNINMSLWEAQRNNEFNKLFLPELFVVYQGLKKHQIQIGADYRWSEFKRNKVDMKSQTIFGIYAQDEWQIHSKLIAMGAIRMDKVENLQEVISPKLALLYKPVRQLFVRASVSKGFHAPSVQEMYEEGFGHGGRALRFGNPDLKPEYSLTLNSSIEYYMNDKISFMGNVYRSEIENMIVPVYKGVWDKDPTKDIWMRQNIMNASIYGYELFTKINIKNAIKLDLGYTVADNINHDDNRKLPYSPGNALVSRLIVTGKITDKINGNFFTAYRYAVNRSAWNWKPTNTMPTDSPEGLVYKLADYHKLDMGLSLKFKQQYEVFFNAYNILAQEIETLDDAYTVYVGKTLYRGGIRLSIKGR